MLYAAGANAAHGLRRTSFDKRRAVETLLKDKEWGQWSDREISRRCHVSDHFVTKIREELSAHGSQIDTARTVQRGGTTYTMDTANIGKPAAEQVKPLNPPARAEPPAAARERTDAVTRKLITPDIEDSPPVHVEQTVYAGRTPEEGRELDHRLYLEASKAEAESFTTPPAEAKPVEGAPDEWAAGAVGLGPRGSPDWSEQEFESYAEAVEPVVQPSPEMTMRDVFDQWLAGQGDAQNQWRLALQLANFGVHVRYWPELVQAIPLGVAYVPDELRQIGAEALARLEAACQEHPAPITLFLERRQAEVLYVAIQRHMIPSRERNELINLLSAALGIVRHAEAA
jgi:hypothetical protein